MSALASDSQIRSAFVIVVTQLQLDFQVRRHDWIEIALRFRNVVQDGGSPEFRSLMTVVWDICDDPGGALNPVQLSTLIASLRAVNRTRMMQMMAALDGKSGLKFHEHYPSDDEVFDGPG